MSGIPRAGTACLNLKLNSSLSSSCAALPWLTLEMQGAENKAGKFVFPGQTGLFGVPVETELTAVCVLGHEGFLTWAHSRLFSLGAEASFITVVPSVVGAVPISSDFIISCMCPPQKK